MSDQEYNGVPFWKRAAITNGQWMEMQNQLREKDQQIADLTKLLGEKDQALVEAEKNCSQARRNYTREVALLADEQEHSAYLIDVITGLLALAREYYCFGLNGFEGEYNAALVAVTKKEQHGIDKN